MTSVMMDEEDIDSTMKASNDLIFFVNGKKIVVNHPDPEMTLLHYLRYKLRLTGTKLGCGEGGCGACTVMYSRFDANTNVLKHYAVNSCLAPICTVHGIAITTVEGIGSIKTKLHPIQKALAESHGSQCGFCTPGIVMSMYSLLRNKPQPNEMELCDAFDGNLCRCTGYRPILDGFYPFTKGNSCPMGENCCQNGGQSSAEVNGEKEENDDTDSTEMNGSAARDESQELIFPPELMLLSPKLHNQNLKFESPRAVWLRPTTIAELLDIKEKYTDCKLVTGNTEIGIETKIQKRHYRVMVNPAFVKELREIETIEGVGMKFGASVTLTIMERELRKAVDTFPEPETRIFKAFVEMLGWFAGRQIRNVASLGGNIINASPISDLNPLLLAIGAEIEVASKEFGHRTIKIDQNFFPGYKKTGLKSNEILVAVTIPYSKENEYFFGYKQANRKEDDIAIVNAGMRVDLGEDGMHVRDIGLAFGGVAENTVMAAKTMKALQGRKWNHSLLELACSQDMLPSDLPLPPNSPGGMVTYRRTLTLSLFFKFYTYVSQRLNQKIVMAMPSPVDHSAGQILARGPSKGSQFYKMPSVSLSEDDTIGKPVIHCSAYKQCTGEAIYLDDLPIGYGELFLGLVVSKKAHAKLVKVDLNKVLEMPGVVDVVSVDDVPGTNEWEVTEQVFADGKVVHEGQIIAGVVATSHAEAQRAANSVEVIYEELETIVTIKEAIQKNALHPIFLKVNTGNTETAFETCDNVVEGNMHVQAQEHFYLEPHGCIVYPKDYGEIEVVGTTQSPNQMQNALVKALGFPANHITVKVKRLGGGFGGKETRNASVILPAAVAAVKTNRTVRCVLDRDEDMCLSGTRHPAYTTYKIGFNNDGKIIALEADLYLNMGSSIDLSIAVLETALLEIDNAYNISNFCVRGHLCKTNLTSCTAYRGFGGPQAIIMAENWVSHVAEFLNMSPEKVRATNFYKEGDVTPIGQTLEMCNITRCWVECITKSDYYRRKHLAEQYNREKRWKKRGLAITPLKYGLAFLLQSMNQGASLVHIYSDGTVLVTHGGVEMGQGLHTKMIQIVSRELEIPISSIHVGETSTATIANAGPTAASMSSDLYGAALLDACAKLKPRLAPYRDAQPDKTLKEWAQAAIQDRVPLTAYGFYRLDGVSLDWTRKKNTPFSYYSFGAACTEVEIDCLTGDHQILRTDIVMDVGQSLNPAIDIGQIEGAFMQGYGLVALEDYKVSPKGIHLSRGPATYKVPSFANIPQALNVNLLKSSINPRAVYSSKGVGEPPLCLATSVLFAIKAAVRSARADAGYKGHFQMDTPATPDKIRMACMDHFTKRFTGPHEETSDVPWAVQL